MGFYGDWFKNLGIPWLTGGPNGQLWWDAIGMVFDDQVAQVKAAVKCRMPTLSPSDALGFLGDERQIDRGPLETDPGYGVRVRASWDAWERAGSPLGLLIALYYAGFPYAVVVQQNGLGYQWTPPGGYTPGNDPTSGLVVTTLGDGPFVARGAQPALAYGDSPWWTFDASSLDASTPTQQFTSRFAVLFPGATYPPSFVQSAIATATFTGVEDGSMSHPWPTAVWSTPFPSTGYEIIPGPAVVTDGSGPIAVVADGTSKTTTGVQVIASASFSGTVGLYADSVGLLSDADLARLRATIKKWRPGKATCAGIFVVARGRCFDWPPCTFDDIATFTDSVVVSYAP